MTDQQIDRLLTAAESIAQSLRDIAERPQRKLEAERAAQWDEQVDGPYQPDNPDDRTFDSMTKKEALAALGIKSDKTLKKMLKAYFAGSGIDVKQLTVGLVEFLKRKKAERHKRLDVANRNRKNSHSKYDGKEGCKDRRK